MPTGVESNSIVVAPLPKSHRHRRSHRDADAGRPLESRSEHCQRNVIEPFQEPKEQAQPNPEVVSYAPADGQHGELNVHLH